MNSKFYIVTDLAAFKCSRRRYHHINEKHGCQIKAKRYRSLKQTDTSSYFIGSHNFQNLIGYCLAFGNKQLTGGRFKYYCRFNQVIGFLPRENCFTRSIVVVVEKNEDEWWDIVTASPAVEHTTDPLYVIFILY